MSGFEGSYLGANDRISPRAVMECKICWTPYDPAQGDDFRQVLPGTPFTALPDDWHCPNCDAPKAQFMVLEDPGSQAMAVQAEIARRTGLLVAGFKEVWHSKMRDVPLVNAALHVEAVGFQPHEGRLLGVLVAPWFMNLVLLPGEEDWSGHPAGQKVQVDFPSGSYEFIHNAREMVGPYMACSLFSPMADFASQLQAVEVARAVMAALFDAANRDETDRAAEIRGVREAELAALEAPEVPVESVLEAPSRRALISAGLAG
ncbi:[NiFe]-hydrogenase assembly chaperone HybE [Rhodobacter ferrooxidans]|uniref:Rubredoxin-type Fe(Cys)4 protein n=1 Tax=Rhodobacter ferrooxidans TaxID=371731 RepID=C8S277_9RHOB|nr:[NiFe]-hydrogenase assembly chaperone HybE [Rhodobacter sp. SW2]EEW24949.1 Rubredoxin-type Fe(Cys)4 protein [Rhodobacter sp. SW2]